MTRDEARETDSTNLSSILHVSLTYYKGEIKKVLKKEEPYLHFSKIKVKQHKQNLNEACSVETVGKRPDWKQGNQFRDYHSKPSKKSSGEVSQDKKKKKAQMKEQIKAPENIQLSTEEIANLSDAQFKPLVIRMLTELAEFGHKLDENMKAMLGETKENVQGTNSDGRETGTQINSVDQKKERNIQPEKNEETRIQKMRRGLGTSRTTLNIPTS